MLWKYIYLNFLKNNIKLIIPYLILNLLIYPIEALGLSRLYSKLITESKNNLSIEIPNYKTLLSKKNILNPNIELIVVYILVTMILLSSIERLKNYFYDIFTPKFKMWIRTEIFNKTLEKYNTNYSDLKIGKEIMRMEELIFLIREIFNTSVTNLLSLVLISIIIGSYLFLVTPNIGIIFIVFLLVLLITLNIIYTKVEKLTKKRISLYFEVCDDVDESYTNLLNILSNNKNEYEKKKIKKKSYEYSVESKKIYLLLSNSVLFIKGLCIVTFFAIVIYAYKILLKNKISNLSFTTIIIVMIYYIGVMNSNVYMITSYIDRITQVKYHMKYLDNLLQNQNNNKLNKKNIKNGKIEFKNLTYYYPKSNKIVLNNLNFTIEPKKRIAILGKSGSGKSTLMKLLIKFYKPNKGKILVDNVNLENIDTTYLRDNITYINQNTLLFDEDIFFNIKYGSKKTEDNMNISPAPSPNLKPSTNLSPSPSNLVYPKEEIIQDSKIEEILKKYDLLTIYDKLEEKLRTKAGPRGSNLSLGMQKVTITMRGILRKSKIIIFDEPLAGLDQRTREKMINLIINETKDKTLIIITHDKEILPYMDKTINLQEINNSKIEN